MKIVLMGEPMGLFMANEPGELNEVKTFTSSIAGAEYNVAVGLSRLGHSPFIVQGWALTRLGKKFWTACGKTAFPPIW